VLFRFSLRRYIPEIFAIKFESCGKSRRILNIFYPPKFSMGTPCKISVRYHPTSHEPHPLVKFREVTPTTPKVIGAHNWILRPILNVRPWNFLGDPRPGLWCALATLGQTLACVKTSGPAPSKGGNIVSWKKTDLGVSKLTCTTVWIMTKVHWTSFFERGKNRSRSVDIRDQSR